MKAFGLRSLHSLLPRFSLAPAAATTTIAHTAAAAVANAPLTLTRGMAAQGGGGGGVGGRGKRRNKKKQGDSRVSMIRYYLHHPAVHTPRPLKFGTMRMLRHWTIHRAWMLHKRTERIERELELERQYNRMRAACDELSRTDEYLYRRAISHKGVGTFPIDMRIPTDTPARVPWNHDWKRS